MNITNMGGRIPPQKIKSEPGVKHCWTISRVALVEDYHPSQVTIQNTREALDIQMLLVTLTIHHDEMFVGETHSRWSVAV